MGEQAFPWCIASGSRTAAVVIVGAIAAALSSVGCAGDVDPTESLEYRDLLDERNEAVAGRAQLAADLRALEDHVAKLENDLEDLRGQAQRGSDELREAREALASAEARRQAAEAERDTALAALEAIEARPGRIGSDSMNDRVLTSEEADDVLDQAGLARFLLDVESLETIGRSLCTVADNSVDAVEFTDSVLESFSGNIASALGQQGVRQFVGVLGSKMCFDELTRLGFEAE